MEQYNIQESANEIHNSKSTLITHDEIKNTPFIITGNEEHGYFIRFGNYKLTEHRNTKTELITELEQEKWNIIARLIVVIMELHTKI